MTQSSTAGDATAATDSGKNVAATKVTPFLWFDGNAEEAMTLYTSLVPNSHVVRVDRAGEQVMSGTFVLDGRPYHAFNGGPMFKFTEAFSLMVNCDTQEEIDRLWSRLTADGGQESRCGWLKDKFGVSWQIVPRQLLSLLQHPDRAKAKRVQQAMMGMAKLEIKGLEEALPSTASPAPRRRDARAGDARTETIPAVTTRGLPDARPLAIVVRRGRHKVVAARVSAPVHELDRRRLGAECGAGPRGVG